MGILIVYYDDLECQGLIIGGLVIGDNVVQHEMQAKHGRNVTVMALLPGAPLELQLAVHSTL